NSQFYFKEYHKMYLSLREWSTHEQLLASIVAFFAEQAKKYLLKYFDLDNRGYFNPRSTFYIISHLIKCRKFKALFYVVPVLFLYKPTGKGYFLRRNLIKNM
ncbi:hypothetical protein, partial [Longispora fulva]|uniref:hypothetical protein n=1 Tax=Longispora fulva TaxID=619741 RepID=UPI00362B0A79